MPRFRERLEKMRIERLDPPKGFESNGLWFRDPDGTLVEIRVAEKSSPNAKAHVRDEGRRCRPPERAEPQQGAQGAAAPARARADLRHRHFAGDRVLPRRAGPAAVGPLRRSGRLHARHPRQRPSHDRLREVGRPGPAPSELGRRLDQRHRRRREPHGREGLRLRLGARPPRARLELFPLRPRSVGQLRGIFLRHRLHPGRPRTGRTATIRRRTSFYMWGPNPPEDFAHNFEVAK